VRVTAAVEYGLWPACMQKHTVKGKVLARCDCVMHPERMCRPKVVCNVQNNSVTILALHTRINAQSNPHALYTLYNA
jgi:hypothetical protein